MERMKNKGLYVSFILLSAALWGTAGIFIRTLEGVLGEMEMVLWRALVSSAIIAVIILIKDVKLFKAKLKDIPLLAASGIISIVLFNYSYYKTMSLTSLSVAAVLLYTAPFFVVVISVIAFKEKITTRKIFACMVAFLGCCMVSGLFGGEHRISGEALFFGLLTGFGYAMYTIFGELLLEKGYSSLTITFYTFLTATIGCLPFVNVVHAVGPAFSSPVIFLTVIGMSLVNTVLPYLLYTNGLKGVDPSSAPIMATVEPVVATIIGVYLYAEPLGIVGAIGILLVLCAVLILNIKSKNKIELKANAKINLTLGILGKLDNGYHSIDTVMQSVGIYDNIVIRKRRNLRVKCDKCDILEEENIAYKAAKLFFEETGINGGAHIRIKKGIPERAGLGGGSADAAAVLVSLDRIYKTCLEEEKLVAMAEKLGADVPFFIKGGTIRAEGIGEKLTECADFDNCYILLIKDSEKSSTGEMYKKLDESDFPVPDTEAFLKALSEKDYEKICDLVENSFTAVSGQEDLIGRIKLLGADAVCLSGSGPTVFALYKFKEDAIKAYEVLSKECNECFITEPCKKSLIFE